MKCEQFVLAQVKIGNPGGSEVKASAYNAGDLGSIPGSGRGREQLEGGCISAYLLICVMEWDHLPGGKFKDDGKKPVPSPPWCLLLGAGSDNTGISN